MAFNKSFFPKFIAVSFVLKEKETERCEDILPRLAWI